ERPLRRRDVAAAERRRDLADQRRGGRDHPAQAPGALERDRDDDDRADQQGIRRDRTLLDQRPEVEFRVFHRLRSSWMIVHRPRATRPTSFSHCDPNARTRTLRTIAASSPSAMSVPPPCFEISWKLSWSSL